MKKFASSIAFIVFCFIAFYSCSKFDQNSATPNLQNKTASAIRPYVQKCLSGQTWDFYLGKCVPICQSGYHNDSTTGACVPNAAPDSITIIKNDPDFITISNALYTYYNIFVTKKINMSTYNLQDSALFLKTTGATQSQLNTLVANIKVAGQRLVARYHFNSSQCATCGKTFAQQDSAFNSMITLFQNNPTIYNDFVTNSLGIGSGGTQAAGIQPMRAQQVCCGFWFYACCGLAAATIEAFPIYLAACAYCYHSECCH